MTGPCNSLAIWPRVKWASGTDGGLQRPTQRRFTSVSTSTAPTTGHSPSHPRVTNINHTKASN